MKPLTLILAFTLALTAHAARRRAVTRPALDELTISFAGANGSLLEVGSVTRQVRQTVGVRIDRHGGSERTVVLRAYVDGGDGVCMVRIDGGAVGVVPVIIDLQAPIGAFAVHRITIDIPASAPEGALSCPIVWEAVTP